MPSVPSKLLVVLLLSLIPSLTPYHSGLSSHRLKPLEKSDWRVTTVLVSLDMSSVCGNLDVKDAEFEIRSSPTQCSKGSKHTFLSGSDDSQESDGDETGYKDQIVNEEFADNSTSGSLTPKSSDDEEKNENITTTPVVLIPAIKGSREKYGLSLRKSSVSWAADVYDPPPSIASHTRSKKQQPKSKSKDNHRKSGKKGLKGKDNSSSRGGSSKDKKKSGSRKHSCDKFDWVVQMPLVAASS